MLHLAPGGRLRLCFKWFCNLFGPVEVREDLETIQKQAESADALDIAAEIFCIADLPAIKATKVRATKFITYMSCDATPSCLSIAVHIASRCTHLHAWLFETQNLCLRQPFFQLCHSNPVASSHLRQAVQLSSLPG